MALKLRIVGSGGTGCCPCDQTIGCDCTAVACFRECRSKTISGTAELCGFSEFADPSVPPKKYRVATTSFSVAYDTYQFSANCLDTEPSPFSYTHNGMISYSSTTCVKSGVITEVNSLGQVQTFSDPTLFHTVCGVTAVNTKTENTGIIGPDCCIAGIEAAYKFTSIAGGTTLSDEDTEEDAEARALASVTEWSGGTCEDHTAYRTLRLAGQMTFASRVAQFRVTIGSEGSPLIPGHSYEVTMRIVRRLLSSSGPFLPHSVVQFTLTASGPTKQGDWIDIPNEAGWETKAAGCSVIDITP